eukprot:11921643-Karenia_brevis.AAC.1
MVIGPGLLRSPTPPQGLELPQEIKASPGRKLVILRHGKWASTLGVANFGVAFLCTGVANPSPHPQSWDHFL